MDITVLKCKLHQARVTHSKLEYDGSCAIDGTLLDQAGICEYEQIHIYNLANGERLITYAIRAEAGSGIISMNGAAALKANPDDRIIICAYAEIEHSQNFKPTLIYLDENNAIKEIKHSIPLQTT